MSSRSDLTSQKRTSLVNLCTLQNRVLYTETLTFFYFSKYTFIIYNSSGFRKCIQCTLLVLCETSDRKINGAKKINDGPLGYPDTLKSHSQCKVGLKVVPSTSFYHPDAC